MCRTLFENLLVHGENIKGDPNKSALIPEEQNEIEMCAQYVIWALFDGREDYDRFREERKKRYSYS